MNGRSLLVIAFTASSLVCTSAPARSGTPYLPKCYWFYPNTYYNDVATMSLYNLPDGTGSDLADAHYLSPGNQVVNATIMVAIKDDVDAWVYDFPAEDLWLEATNGNLVFCPNSPAIADGPTAYYRMPPVNPNDPTPPLYEW